MKRTPEESATRIMEMAMEIVMSRSAVEDKAVMLTTFAAQIQKEATLDALERARDAECFCCKDGVPFEGKKQYYHINVDGERDLCESREIRALIEKEKQP